MQQAISLRTSQDDHEFSTKAMLSSIPFCTLAKRKETNTPAYSQSKTEQVFNKRQAEMLKDANHQSQAISRIHPSIHLRRHRFQLSPPSYDRSPRFICLRASSPQSSLMALVRLATRSPPRGCGISTGESGSWSNWPCCDG